MKHIIILILFIAVILFSRHCLAQSMPLENELLAEPIALECGLKVIEVKGTVIGKSEKKTLNNLCTRSLDFFPAFVAKAGEPIRSPKKFSWTISLIPATAEYRCLNDIENRFVSRNLDVELWGYTSITNNHMFVISNIKHSEFKVTFVHELFHSMSLYYGIWDSHPGTFDDKVVRDEELAERFTSILGYGK